MRVSVSEVSSVPPGRRRWRRSVLAVASALVLALAVAACGSSSSSSSAGAGTSSSAETEGGQAPFTTAPKAEVASLAIAYSDKLVELDPIMAGNVTDIAIVNLLNANLFAFPLDGSENVEPSLAESGEFSAGDKVFTVKLKSGLTFSDGKPLTADDVAATVERGMNSKTTLFAGQFAPITKVTAVDSRTVKFDFSRPFPSVETLLAYPNFGILEASEIGADGSIPKVPVGAGQYVAEGDLFGNQFTLKRNEHYGAGPKPAAAALDFTVESDPTARFQQLASDQFQFAFDLPAPALKNPPSTVLPQYRPLPGFDYMVMNDEAAPLNDPSVRRAISLAIDREKVSEIAWQGLEKGIGGFFPSAFGSVSKPAAAPDVAAAKKLLVGTPCASGCDIEMLVPGGFSWAPPTGVTIQNSLKAIGINLTLTTLDTTTVTNKLLAAEFQTSLIYFTDNTTVPEGLPTFCLDPEGGVWACLSHWNSKEAHQLVEEAKLAPAGPERDAIYEQLNTLYEKDQPFATLTDYTYTSGTAESAAGMINLTPQGLIQLAPLK
jgi:peptide/nickel transport system substrate-binding protein